MKNFLGNMVTDIEFAQDMYRCQVNGARYFGNYCVFNSQIVLTCHRYWSYHIPVDDSIIESIRFDLSLLINVNN